MKHWFNAGRNYTKYDLLLNRTPIFVNILPDQFKFYNFVLHGKHFKIFAEVAEPACR